MAFRAIRVGRSPTRDLHARAFGTSTTVIPSEIDGRFRVRAPSLGGKKRRLTTWTLPCTQGFKYLPMEREAE